MCHPATRRWGAVTAVGGMSAVLGSLPKQMTRAHEKALAKRTAQVANKCGIRMASSEELDEEPVNAKRLWPAGVPKAQSKEDETEQWRNRNACRSPNQGFEEAAP